MRTVLSSGPFRREELCDLSTTTRIFIIFPINTKYTHNTNIIDQADHFTGSASDARMLAAVLQLNLTTDGNPNTGSVLLASHCLVIGSE